MDKLFKDWKSSLAGLGTAFFAFVLFSPEHFAQWPWLIDLAKYAMAGGLATLGIVVRDASRTTPMIPPYPDAARTPVVDQAPALKREGGNPV